jgi:hypothetical protein
MANMAIAVLYSANGPASLEDMSNAFVYINHLTLFGNLKGQGPSNFDIKTSTIED